jgi:hypothetical protein
MNDLLASSARSSKPKRKEREAVNQRMNDIVANDDRSKKPKRRFKQAQADKKANQLA